MDSGYLDAVTLSSYIYKCVKSIKFRRSTEQQQMANLPHERMEETPPFSYCGMDCFGPFYVKDGMKELKRYGLLFTCLCSRAVHIELLEEMTTDHRLFHHRSPCLHSPTWKRQLCNDQGTNFVGARYEFLEALKEMDEERLKLLGCEFVMNQLSASHMGGAWERQIRTIRSVLTSILDQSSQRLGSWVMKLFIEILSEVCHDSGRNQSSEDAGGDGLLKGWIFWKRAHGSQYTSVWERLCRKDLFLMKNSFLFLSSKQPMRYSYLNIIRW